MAGPKAGSDDRLVRPQPPTGFSGPRPWEVPGRERDGGFVPIGSAAVADETGAFLDPRDQQLQDLLISYVNPETGELEYATYAELVAAGLLPPGLTIMEARGMMRNGTVQAGIDALFGGGSGRGRGRGAQGPVYVKPDERLVREAVRATLAALAGRVDPAQLDDLVATYMSESQRSFDVRESEQVDPMETVKAKIRETAEYKSIHQMRPESVDEMDWISSRTGALKRAGVTDKVAQDLGIAQATIGASEQDAAYAGNVATFAQSGKLLEELKGRISTSTYSALRLI